MKKITITAVLFLIMGCATSGPIDGFPAPSDYAQESVPSQPVSQTATLNDAPSEEFKTFKLLWDIEQPAVSAGWTEFVVSKIRASKLVRENPKSDINCTLDSDDERVEFWAQFVSAITKRESRFNTETNYKEDFKDSKGDQVISRGLMQLSFESAKQSAYKCSIQVPKDLNKPLTNLGCGVNIVEFWTKDPMTMGNGLTDQHYGGARYWSVARKYEKLKNGTVRIKDSYKFIKNYLESLPICKKIEKSAFFPLKNKKEKLKMGQYQFNRGGKIITSKKYPPLSLALQPTSSEVSLDRW